MLHTRFKYMVFIFSFYFSLRVKNARLIKIHSYTTIMFSLFVYIDLDVIAAFCTIIFFLAVLYKIHLLLV